MISGANACNPMLYGHRSSDCLRELLIARYTEQSLLLLSMGDNDGARRKLTLISVLSAARSPTQIARLERARGLR